MARKLDPGIMATYRINLGCHRGPLLAHMLLQVNRGLRLLVKPTAIYFLAASEDNALHLGLKDSKFAFNKWSKLE